MSDPFRLAIRVDCRTIIIDEKGHEIVQTRNGYSSSGALAYPNGPEHGARDEWLLRALNGYAASHPFPADCYLSHPAELHCGSHSRTLKRPLRESDRQRNDHWIDGVWIDSIGQHWLIKGKMWRAATESEIVWSEEKP